MASPSLLSWGSWVFDIENTNNSWITNATYSGLGDRGELGPAVNGGIPRGLKLVDYANWLLPSGTAPGTDHTWHTFDFVINNALASNDYMLILMGLRSTGNRKYGVGLTVDSSGNKKFKVWEIDMSTSTSAPTFNTPTGGSATGTNAITGTAVRVCIDIDAVSANAPIRVHFKDSGGWNLSEISTSDSNVIASWEKPEIWQQHISGKGTTGFSSTTWGTFFWNDSDDPGTDAPSNTNNVPDDTYKAIPYFPNANITSGVAASFTTLPESMDKYFVISNNYNPAFGFDFAEYYDGNAATFTDRSAEWKEESASNEWMNTAASTDGDIQYLGLNDQFDGLLWIGTSTYVTAPTFAVEYWTDDGGGAWTAVSGLSDATSAFKGPHGVISWTMPGNWNTTSVDGDTAFWVRVRATGNPNQVVNCTACVPRKRLKFDTAGDRAKFAFEDITTGKTPDEVIVFKGEGTATKGVICATAETTGEFTWTAGTGGARKALATSPGGSTWTESLFNSMQAEFWVPSGSGTWYLYQMFALVIGEGLALATTGVAELNPDVPNICPSTHQRAGFALGSASPGIY